MLVRIQVLPRASTSLPPIIQAQPEGTTVPVPVYAPPCWAWRCHHRLALLLFLLCLLLTPVTCLASKSHILIVALSLRGHVVPLARLATELVGRGHRVTFAVHEDGRDYVNRTGSKFASLGRFPVALAERRERLRQISHDASFFRGTLSLFSEVYMPHNLPVHSALTTLVTKERPDMMVIDIGALGAMDVAHAHNIPFLLNNPSLLFRLDSSPHYVPAWGSGFPERMSLWERCLSLLYPRLLAVALTPAFMDLNKLRYQRALPLFRSQHDMLGKSVMLVNTVFGLEYPMELSPLVKMTGPLLPVNKPALPPSLAQWLDKSTKPVVLVLFGTGSMSYLEPSQVQRLAQGLTESRFRVLWALRSDDRVLLGHLHNTLFKLKSNLPQLAAVAHSAVRVVVSPCGLATAQEALYYGKTLLCIPMLGDQLDITTRIVDAGAGIAADKTRLDPLEIGKNIQALYRNQTYRLAAKRLGKILRAAGGVTQAADIVESTALLGRDHLISHAEQLPWHLAVELDVWAAVFALSLLLLVLTRSLLLSLTHAAEWCCGARFRRMADGLYPTGYYHCRRACRCLRPDCCLRSKGTLRPSSSRTLAKQKQTTEVASAADRSGNSGAPATAPAALSDVTSPPTDFKTAAPVGPRRSGIVGEG